MFYSKSISKNIIAFVYIIKNHTVKASLQLALVVVNTAIG